MFWSKNKNSYLFVQLSQQSVLMIVASDIDDEGVSSK